MYGETTLPFTTLLKRDLQYLDMTFRTNSLFSAIIFMIYLSPILTYNPSPKSSRFAAIAPSR